MKPSNNVAASIKQRLLNRARERKEDFNSILQRYVSERLLYRISRSSYEKEFILKGAMLFSLWLPSFHRATKDLDLLGRGSPDLTRLAEVFRKICAQDVEDDGLVFLPETVHTARIRENAEYEGIRVEMEARLGNARIHQQVDVGFGDIVKPVPRKLLFPTVLEMPAPHIRAYSREAVVAEKLHAAVILGIPNSRMKDFYDLHRLAMEFDFDGPTLCKAVASTFKRRRTVVPNSEPVALTAVFASDPVKQTQWSAFLRKTRAHNTSLIFEDVVRHLRGFLLPVIEAVASSHELRAFWKAQGPWVIGQSGVKRR